MLLGKRTIVQIKEQLQSDGEKVFATYWPFTERPVKAFVADLETDDPGLSTVLAQIYSRYAVHMIDRDKADEAAEYFRMILKRRPDPHSENDKLRYQIAVRAKGTTARYLARDMVRELMEGGSSKALVRLRLLVRGYYGYTYVFLFAVSMFLLSIFGAVLVRRGRAPAAVAMEPRSNRRAPSEPKKKKRKGEKSGYLYIAEHDDEYAQLLDFFGLEEGASNDDIKAAYRQLAKESHPDSLRDQLTPDEFDAATDYFMEIKRAYERIIEIRRRMFNTP